MAHRGVSYAHSLGVREQLQQEDLQRLYQDINQGSFDGKLPDVPVRWGDLTEADAYGITHFDRDLPYAMELDRKTVSSRSFALDVIRHESCHIATNREAKRRNEDPHGLTFVACMARVQEHETGD
jgi:predicted SprT family Zn-dependent metalloprotease